MPECQSGDAVAYHRRLAGDWERRYQKPSFRARLRVLEECLAGRDIHDQDWLDAGCGSGTLARYLAEKGGRVLGVDAAEDMIAAARQLRADPGQGQQLRFERIVTIADLPLARESLDGILCSSVLEYVPDPAACLAEFARVLRPSGLLIVSVPNRKSVIRRVQVIMHKLGRALQKDWLPFLQYSQNEYSAADFRQRLREFGFSTEKIVFFGSPIPVWLQHKEFAGSLLAACAKRE